MQWIVTRTNTAPGMPGPARGPRWAEPVQQIVEAAFCKVDNGALIFHNLPDGEDLVLAFARDGWSSVTPYQEPTE